MSIPINTMPIFSGDNYDSWSVRMRTLFLSQDLWDVIESGISVPKNTTTLTAQQQKELREGQKRNVSALFIIQQAVDDELFESIMRVTSAKEAWDTLKQKAEDNDKSKDSDESEDNDKSKDSDESEDNDETSQEEEEKRFEPGDEIPPGLARQYYSSGVGLDIEMDVRRSRRARLKELNRRYNVAESSIAKHATEPQNLIDLGLYEAAKFDLYPNFKVVLERIATEKKLDLSVILERVSPSDNTLLHVAANFDKREIAGFIACRRPSLLTRRNFKGDTALHLAAKAGNSNTAVELLQLKSFSADENTVQEKDLNKELPRLVNDGGNTALHEALIHGHVELAKTIIQADPEVSFYLNKERKSPLYLAAEAGYKECIEQMLGQLTDTNVDQALQGKSPIHAAVMNAATKREATDILDVLLEKEPRFMRLRDEKGRTVLHLAASIDYLDGVFYLLRKDEFAAFQRDENGFLPIHVASIEGHLSIIKKLVRHFPDPEEMLTTNFENILHLAAKSGSCNVVSYILKASELSNLINQRDRDGDTPLHVAAMNWHPKIVDLLTRDKRVNLQLVNKEGLTALDVAEDYMFPPTFQERLTWAALKAAGTPQASFPDTDTTKLHSLHDPYGAGNRDNYKERINTLLLVSTLIATITFAAGFTAPGGFNDSDPDKGMAIFLKHKEFGLFILCDMIAMYSSIIVAVTLIWAQLADLRLALLALRFALPLLGVALVMMSLAFMAGIYLMVNKLKWLGYVVLAAGPLFLVVLSLLFFPLVAPYSSTSQILRFISYYSFKVLVFLTDSHTKGEGSRRKY